MRTHVRNLLLHSSSSSSRSRSTSKSLSNVYTQAMKECRPQNKSKVSKNRNESEFGDVLSIVQHELFGNWPIVFTATNLLLLYIGAVESQCQWTIYTAIKHF